MNLNMGVQTGPEKSIDSQLELIPKAGESNGETTTTNVHTENSDCLDSLRPNVIIGF